MPCYSRSRIWKTKPIRTLLDHENLAKKRIEKTQNTNPNLQRRLCGGCKRWRVYVEMQARGWMLLAAWWKAAVSCKRAR